MSNSVILYLDPDKNGDIPEPCQTLAHLWRNSYVYNDNTF